MAVFSREQLVAVAELVLKAKNEFPDVDPSDPSIQEDLILQKARSYLNFKVIPMLITHLPCFCYTDYIIVTSDHIYKFPCPAEIYHNEDNLHG